MNSYIHIWLYFFFSLNFRRNWTWRLLSCIFGHGEKPPWWKHGSPSLWGYTSGNVWHSCLCFFHLRQSMFLFSNLFKLWNFYYIYSCLHVEWPFSEWHDYFCNRLVMIFRVFLLFIFKALHFLNLCPIFVILFYFENVCVPILQSCAYWPTDKGQLIPKGLFFQFFQKTTSRLGQKLKISSSFFGRIEDTRISFRD